MLSECFTYSLMVVKKVIMNLQSYSSLTWNFMLATTALIARSILYLFIDECHNSITRSGSILL
jgi:hypothetical protein